MLITRQRPLHHAGEEQQIQRKAVDAALRLDRPAKDVELIAQRLKYEERQSQRERQGGDARAEDPGEKAEVFEQEQQPQIERQPEREGKPPRPPHPQPETVIGKRRCRNEQKAGRLAPCVKRQTAQKRHDIFQTARHEVIDQKKRRQKIKQKADAAEAHDRSLSNFDK